MAFYYIRSALNPDLVLTLAADQVTVVVSWLDLSQPGGNAYQQWELTGSDPNLAITNKGNGLQLTASNFEGAALSVAETGNTWSVANSTVVNTAIRPSWNFDLNISCQSGLLNNNEPAILWSWGGNNTDKTWTFQDVSTFTPYPTREILIQAGGPSRALRDDVPTIKADGGSDFPVGDQNVIWIATCWSTGISFKNKATGQYITYAGDDSALVAGAYAMGIQALWTTVVVNTDPRPWIAIRPYLNSDMNLNSFGGTDPGDTIGVWSWGGGNQNEIWLMHNLDSSSWAGC